MSSFFFFALSTTLLVCSSGSFLFTRAVTTSHPTESVDKRSEEECTDTDNKTIIGLEITKHQWAFDEGDEQPMTCKVLANSLAEDCSDLVKEHLSAAGLLVVKDDKEDDVELIDGPNIHEDGSKVNMTFKLDYEKQQGGMLKCVLEIGSLRIESNFFESGDGEPATLSIHQYHPVTITPTEVDVNVGQNFTLSCTAETIDAFKFLRWKRAKVDSTSMESYYCENIESCQNTKDTETFTESIEIDTSTLEVGRYTFVCTTSSLHGKQASAKAIVAIHKINRTGLYVGGPLGGFFVLAGVVAIAVVFWRKRKERRRLVRNQRIGAHRELMKRMNNEYTEEQDGTVVENVPSMNTVASIIDRIAQKYSRWEIQRSSLMIKQQIGMGNFGAVYIGTMPDSTGIIQTVAVKTIKEHSTEAGPLLEFEKEMGIMGVMSHEKIVQFLGISSTAIPVLIIMEFMKNGPLNSYVMKLGPTKEYPDGRLSVKQLSWLCAQPCDALDYLSEKGLVHRDVSARNCLVGENLVVKLADFGMSRDTTGDGKNYYKKEGGMVPVKWMAPEALTYGRYTTANDIWGFGVMVWEVFSFGATPYAALNNQEVAITISKGQRLGKPATCPEELWLRIVECWKEDPNERIILSALRTFLLDFAEGHLKTHPEPSLIS